MARKPVTPIVQHRRKVIRRAGTILVLGIGSPWVTATVNKPIPLGISASVALPITATLNRPIPLGRSITASGAALPGGHGAAAIVHRRKPVRRLGTIQIQGIVSPPQALAATLTKAIPIGRTIAGTAIDSVLPGSGSLLVGRLPIHKRRKHITIRVAPNTTPVVGSSATLNRAIPIGRSITGIVGVGARVTRAIPIGRFIVVPVRVDARLVRPIPIGRSISGTSGSSPVPVGTPTSAIPTDNGLRSVVVIDAGSRSAILADNGRQSVIVNNTT